MNHICENGVLAVDVVGFFFFFVAQYGLLEDRSMWLLILYVEAIDIEKGQSPNIKYH